MRGISGSVTCYFLNPISHHDPRRRQPEPTSSNQGLSTGFRSESQYSDILAMLQFVDALASVSLVNQKSRSFHWSFRHALSTRSEPLCSLMPFPIAPCLARKPKSLHPHSAWHRGLQGYVVQLLATRTGLWHPHSYAVIPARYRGPGATGKGTPLPGPEKTPALI